MNDFDAGAHVVARLTANTIPGIISVYVFGSEAEGRTHRESDLDIGALLDWGVHTTSDQRFETRLALIAELSRGLAGREVDVVILNDAPPLLGRKIITQGNRVHCSSVELDHAYVRDIQLRAADIEPFLRRMSALKLASLGGT